MNRLLKGIYQRGTNVENVTHSYDEIINYDKNGNITDLKRHGYLDVHTGESTYPIDDLVYGYNGNQSNRLTSVLDQTQSIDGFRDGNPNGVDYDYDDFGNMITDRNKSIEIIQYNHLNLPVKIIFTGEGENQITYLYNALGVKLGKTVRSTTAQEGTTETLTYYLGGFQYLTSSSGDGGLKFFPTAEGYVSVTNGDKFNYVFNYTDHLGNIRVSYSIDPADQQLKILEENHYYPFGLKHSNYNTNQAKYKKDADGVTVVLRPTERSDYQYKYNGKEFQDELGLNMYSMDMRQYDPAIARWVVQDPVIHHSQSPYNGFDNNPVFWADPSGADAVYNWDTGKYMDGNTEVSFEQAMASHGLNADGDPIKTTTDAGHGDKTGCCVDPGTLDGNNYEKDFALKVETSVDSWLKKWGIDNQRTRTGDIDKKGQKKIAWRLKSAKDHGSIVMISIHLDSGSKDGLFAIYDGDNSESKKLALSIVNAYSFGLGDSDGIKSDVRNLGLVQRFSGNASVLIELGGIGNTELINRINQNSNLMGYDIARGMYKYLTGNEPPSKNVHFEWPKSPYTSFLNY